MCNIVPGSFSLLSSVYSVQDELERNIIPQIPLFDLLSKFNGATEKVIMTFDLIVY